jgi:hypothetical protein
MDDADALSRQICCQMRLKRFLKLIKGEVALIPRPNADPIVVEPDEEERDNHCLCPQSSTRINVSEEEEDRFVVTDLFGSSQEKDENAQEAKKVLQRSPRRRVRQRNPR